MQKKSWITVAVCYAKFDDSASIAEKVIEIIENKSLQRSLEQNAYNNSRKFTWSLVAKKCIAVFDELTRQSKEEEQSLAP